MTPPRWLRKVGAVSAYLACLLGVGLVVCFRGLIWWGGGGLIFVVCLLSWVGDDCHGSELQMMSLAWQPFTSLHAVGWLTGWLVGVWAVCLLACS